MQGTTEQRRIALSVLRFIPASRGTANNYRLPAAGVNGRHRAYNIRRRDHKRA
jgi:hypothetical protein